jgi:predicted MPP superfamily phosphohydrolase
MKYFIFIFVSIVTVVLVLLHFVIYEGILTAFNMVSPVTTIILRIILIFLAFGFIASAISANKQNNTFSRLFFTFESTWLGFMTYFFAASVVFGIILAFEQRFGLSNSIWIGHVLFILAFIISIYGIIHARLIRIKRYEITIPDVPQNWKNKKVVFISDIHLGQIHGKSFAQKVVTKINELQPDIVLIGGDLYDGVEVNEKEVIEPLKLLKPNLGIYFVTGNHEEFADSAHFLIAIKEIGIRVLINEKVEIDGLQLIGVTDHHSTDKQAYASIMNQMNIDRSRPAILLKHQPSELKIAEENGISLQLSGHTHRAQLFPVNIITYLAFKGFGYGLNQFKNMKVVTSSGVGTWGPPMRVGTNSEIVVIQFI